MKFSEHWRIHSIFIITQFEFNPNFRKNSFHRSKFDLFDFIHVENDTEQIKNYEIKKKLFSDLLKLENKIFYSLKKL